MSSKIECTAGKNQVSRQQESWAMNEVLTLTDSGMLKKLLSRSSFARSGIFFMNHDDISSLPSIKQTGFCSLSQV
jgi:hypothetical protein